MKLRTYPGVEALSSPCLECRRTSLGESWILPDERREPSKPLEERNSSADTPNSTVFEEVLSGTDFDKS